MQVGMVWNVGRNGVERRQEWYGVQVGMAWNVGRSGMGTQEEEEEEKEEKEEEEEGGLPYETRLCPFLFEL